jgi:16S rRNA pseudouridine516 synthase
LGSRKEVKEYIRKGMISVNGELATSAAGQINPDQDIVSFQGKEYKYAEFNYYMLHKPPGYISATKDERVACVIDLFKEESVKNLFPVGRLDKDTEGLLLVTNDGDFAHRITSPSKHLPKKYYVELNGKIEEFAIEQFMQGLDIGDEKITSPAILEILESTPLKSRAYITITEGRYHQVKRMFMAIYLRVTYLKRVSIGGLSLDEKLPIGEYRLLTDLEQELIFK